MYTCIQLFLTCTLSHAVSKAEYVVIPHFRVLTSSGAWIWMQAEVTLRYKCGTTVPELCDLRCRAIR